MRDLKIDYSDGTCCGCYRDMKIGVALISAAAPEWVLCRLCVEWAHAEFERLRAVDARDVRECQCCRGRFGAHHTRCGHKWGEPRPSERCPYCAQTARIGGHE